MIGWSATYRTWQVAAVPPVGVIEFDLNRHFSTLPWLCLETGQQLIGTSNPQRATAYHLAVLFRRQSDDVFAAYKIAAFLRHADVRHHEGAKACWNVLSKHAAPYELWHSNAKAVLPWFGLANAFLSEEANLAGWNEIVAAAARAWTSLASELVVVRVPDFMEADTPEFQQYIDHCNRLHEERERVEYLRLKNKFEPDK